MDTVWPTSWWGGREGRQEHEWSQACREQPDLQHCSSAAAFTAPACFHYTPDLMYVYAPAFYLADGRAWLVSTWRRTGLPDSDWLCSLAGCGLNMNDCSWLVFSQVLGISTEEGCAAWNCKSRGDCIGAAERKGEGESKQERTRKREGGSGSKTGLPLKTLQSFFSSLRKQSFASHCLSLLLGVWL